MLHCESKKINFCVCCFSATYGDPSGIYESPPKLHACLYDVQRVCGPQGEVKTINPR